MDTTKAQNRILDLRKILNHHNHNYYVLSEPEISDYDYDMLLKELTELENEFPVLTGSSIAFGDVDNDQDYDLILAGSNPSSGRSSPSIEVIKASLARSIWVTTSTSLDLVLTSRLAGRSSSNFPAAKATFSAICTSSR